jgi:putative tricarboxylic transport membrane protein
MYIGNAMLLALNLPLIGIWVRVLRIPYRILFPMILIFCLIGVYSINASIFEMFLVTLFGVFGYVMRKLDYEMAPLLMGVVLAPMFETALRQALLLSRGSFSIFVTRPISAFFLIASILFLVRSGISRVKKGKGDSRGSKRV